VTPGQARISSASAVLDEAPAPLPRAADSPRLHAGRRPNGVTAWFQWRRLWPPVLAISTYCLISAFVYGAHSPVSSTTLPPCACDDLALQSWFLEWPAYAIAHGHNPFYSAWVNYPSGVNLMDNTGAPLLGLAFAPVTWLLGPVASLSFVMRLAFAVSASSMCLVVRRWTSWWPAAFIGGLVYAFSPYMIGQSYSHDFLSFVPLPPIIFLLLDELVVRRRKVIRNGALLGAVITAQLLISPELLGICAVAAFGSLGVMAVRHPLAVRDHWRQIGSGLAMTGTGFLVSGAYPLWVYVRGAYHVSGPQHHLSALESYHTALGSLIFPTSLERFGTSGMFAQGNTLAQGNNVEHTVYMGAPLLLLLGFMVAHYRRAGVVQLLSLLALGAWAVTLGTTLHLGPSAHLGIPLPYDLLVPIPLVNSSLDVRYSFVMYFAVAVLVAIGLDRLYQDQPSGGQVWARLRLDSPRSRAVVCLAVAVVALAPLLPRLPLTSTPLGVPAVFTNSSSPVADGDVVLTYPLPVGYGSYANDQALLWQASARMRFKLIGFRGAIAGPDHKPLVNAAVFLPPPQAEEILVWSLYGRPSPPPNDSATSRSIRTFLAEYHVDDITVVPSGVPAQPIIDYFTAALQQSPSDFQGTYVWSHIPQLLTR
jgi:hypothetical protein